jgi:anti-sigma factor RsiW
MTAPTCDNETMRSLVGFLVLGRLTAEERAAVTEHLRACPACRAERDEVDTVVSVLGLLTEDDVRELVSEYGVTAPAATRNDQLFGAPGAPRVVRTVGEPARPGAIPRKPRRRLRTGTVLAAAGVAALTLSTVLLLGPWGASNGLGPVVAVAATRDNGSGVDMSATVYAEDGRVSVRLSANNLPPGAYQLYAVTVEGEDLLLGRLTGEPGKGTYAGTIPVPVGRLMSFQLRQIDGALLVSADVTKGSPG